MDQIWTGILEFINQLVSPDWASLIALVPLLLALLLGLYLAWLIARYANAGPKRRGKSRMEPRPPAGVHAAERSWAPVIAAVALLGLMYGLVLGGWVLAGGAGLLVLSLIYWLREGMRDYDHVEHPTSGSVPRPSGTPPPGIHIPGPSFRPILASLALAALLFGLVFGGWLVVAGVFMLAIALLQWLADARREYRGVVIADVTGHLPADPRPGYPRTTLGVFAVLFAGAIVLQTGILPPRSASGGTAPAASGAPGASGAPSSPGASGAGASPASTGPSAAPADLTITAETIAFVGGAAAEHVVPGDKPFTIAFQNKDAGIPHNIVIHDGGAGDPVIWNGDIFPGVETRIYQVPAIKAGTYTFICVLHPSMTGTLVVK